MANQSNPPRIVEGTGGVADLVRRYVQETEGGDDVLGPTAYAAWGARQRARRARRGALLGLTAVGGVALLVGWIVSARPHGDGAAVAVGAAPAAPPVPASPVAPAGTEPLGPRAEPIAEARADVPAPPATVRRRRLDPGASTLGTEARVALSADGRADVVHFPDGETRIELQSGAVDLVVAHRTHRAPLRVIAGRFAFKVVGTEFQVRRSGEDVALEVRTGVVAVSRGTGRLATVEGPGHWRSTPDAEPNPRPGLGSDSGSTTESNPGSAPGPTPGSPPGSNPGSTPGSNPGAEAAVYRLGLTRMKSGGDLNGAAAAFRRCLAEYPHGALRIEATLSLVEILPALGQHREALERSAALLAEQPALERAAELRVVRGNIYREALKDFDKAAWEYGLAASAPGRTGDDAAFFGALAAELAGRKGEAVERYAAYLRRPSPARGGEARRRMEALQP